MATYRENLDAAKEASNMGSDLPDGMADELKEVLDGWEEDYGAPGTLTPEAEAQANRELVEAINDVCTSWGYPSPCKL